MTIRSKEHEETAALEKAIEQVADNLKRTTVSTIRSQDYDRHCCYWHTLLNFREMILTDWKSIRIKVIEVFGAKKI